MAIKVKLRQKPLKNGRQQSLYLDFYPAIIDPKTGKPTRREFLGLYIIAETEKDSLGRIKKISLNPLDKVHNKETLQLAEQIRQKRENNVNKPEIYTGYEKEQIRLKEIAEIDFVQYFRKLADKRKASNHDNWISAYNYLMAFTGGSLPFGSLNEKFCGDFREYLLNTQSLKRTKEKLSQNSAFSYFNKFKASLKQAYKDGLLQTDLNRRVEPIKPGESQRNFLTLEELNKLVKTDCKDPVMKRAALFAALTGLRFSDIQKLVWGEIENIKGSGYIIRFRQQKTKGLETLPVSNQAIELLGKKGTAESRVFEGLKYSAYANKHLAHWIGAAGITKDITFHCFRHTFATLQLSNGTDIYTVSKMLGHRDLKTTQIYTKVIDQNKRAAAERIKLNIKSLNH